MSNKRSIRSFFSPAPKRVKDSDSTSTEPQVKKDEDTIPSSTVDESSEEHDSVVTEQEINEKGTIASVELSGETSNLLSSLISTCNFGSWQTYLESEFSRAYFKRLVSFVDKEIANRTVYPPRDFIFSAFQLCDFDSIKVVILGQDPYHGPNQAHGLAFSVLRGNPPPPSLKNIFKEAKADVGIRAPTHGDLSCWSKQGVLLLNTCLTVRRGEANSHQKKGWEEFTDAVVRYVSRKQDGVVFMLWGKPAQTKCKSINTANHVVISSSHPSPLGATKTNEPFIGSRCFSRCNDALIKMGKDPIDWNIN